MKDGTTAIKRGKTGEGEEGTAGGGRNPYTYTCKTASWKIVTKMIKMIYIYI